MMDITMNSVDSETSAESTSSTPSDSKNIIDKILGEMKSQFNKTDKPDSPEEPNLQEVTVEDMEPGQSSIPMDDIIISENPSEPPIEKTETTSTNGNDMDDNADDKDKVRIVLLFKKPTADGGKQASGASTGRRSGRHKPNATEDKVDEPMLKRSARRRSKDCTESILQSAIARKEKSYNETNKPQRLTRQLKPTPKILENLALAKQEKKLEKGRATKNPIKSTKLTDASTYADADDANDRLHRKHKHKHHHHKHAKKYPKKMKMHYYADDSNKLSDSEQSADEDEDAVDNSKDKHHAAFRRSRRISLSKSKEDMDEQIYKDNSDDMSDYLNNVKCSTVGAELIASRLCLCTHKTQYYLAASDEEITYCGAYDNIGEKIVGCSRVVDSPDIMMLRPSARVPYAVMCDSHRNRMLRHNCCPTCGIFCTQGRFVECPAKHHYHRNCQLAVGNVECCPHCGLSTPDYDVNITMHSSRKPVFLPMQKSHYVSARITFQNHKRSDEEFKAITPPLIPLETLELLSASEYHDELYDVGDLVMAIKNDAVEKVASILVSKSCDLHASLSEINDGTFLHLAAHYGSPTTVHMLLLAGLQVDVFDKEQNTPLMLAVAAAKNDLVQYLIKAGACIDIKGTDGMTALHVAAKSGNLKACELLMRAASPVRDFVNIPDDGGWTPLVWACEHGYTSVANFLINKGADPSIRDVEHNVALHWAAFSGRSQIVEMLLNKSCDVNAVNAHGDTPLHIAARQDMYNCVIVLLVRGANVTLLNKNNESPIDSAPEDGTTYHPISLNIAMQVNFDRPGTILTNDISKGKEANPIQCRNNVDSEPQPNDFVYITKSCVNSDDVKIDCKLSTMQSCTCQERCTEDDCSCGKLSVRCWYDERGKVIPDFNFADIPMIFECNDGCSCNAITCNNRVVQKGLTQRFELFKAAGKGWGVRSLRPIAKGSFVCEYVGEIITDLEAERRDDDSFLFDLENRVCKNINESESYCIDAKFYGNFSRFINHSCNPNLTSVKVFVDHQDLRFPRIAFFANRDIVTDEELSFDYGVKFWIAKYKSLSCLCGTEDCKYSEETVDSSIQDYQRKFLEDCQ